MTTEKKAMERIDLPTIVGEMKIKDYGVFRRRVMDECGISRTTFYQWRCGRCVPGKAAQTIINGILAEMAQQ